MDVYSSTDIGHVSFSGLNEPCSIGSIVEVVVCSIFLPFFFPQSNNNNEAFDDKS